MTLSFTMDLHNIHVLGFAGLGAVATKATFGRELHSSDRIHFLHTASLLALGSSIRYAADDWIGLGLAPRSQLSVKVAQDMGVANLVPVGAAPEEREQMARRAAEHLAADMRTHWASGAIEDVSERVPAGLGQIEADVTRATRAVLQRNCSAEDRARLYQLHRASPNNSSLLMLTLSDLLHSAIHDHFWHSLSSSADHEEVTNRLETVLRMYTYMYVSEPSAGRAWYSPAFDRRTNVLVPPTPPAAIVTSATTSSILEENMPALIHELSMLLLKRSDGSPRHILRLAIEFRREHGDKVDAHFSHFLSAYERRDDAQAIVAAQHLQNEFKTEFAELSAMLRQRLGGFTAGNGSCSRGVNDVNRSALVKADIHQQQVRLRLEDMELFVTLGHHLENGEARSHRAGWRNRDSIRARILANKQGQQLIKAVARSNVVIVAGAGTTLFATGDCPRYTWKGILLDGLDYMAAIGASAEQVPIVEGLLDQWPSLSTYKFAGDVIRTSLGDRQWHQWLNDLFFSMPVKDTELLEAIVGLQNVCGVRIATTNYDLLFESYGLRRLSACVPAKHDEAAVECFLTNERKDHVFHIHGTYETPDTIVLGSESYGLLRGSRSFGYIERLFECPLVFVGFSAFDDPTFARLGQYLEHFRFRTPPFVLMTEQERKQWDRQELTPVVYGTKHAELPGFLHAMREIVTGEE